MTVRILTSREYGYSTELAMARNAAVAVEEEGRRRRRGCR